MSRLEEEMVEKLLKAAAEKEEREMGLPTVEELEQKRREIQKVTRSGNLTATETIAAASGVKHDAEKLRVDLLPVDVLKGVAEILTHGAKKYRDRNWEEGIAYSRLYGATLRHLFTFWQGDDVDPESHLLHLDHALCELMFLRAMSKRRPDLDDRPKEG